MNDDGPDPDAVAELAGKDPSIKGIWVVPTYANPSGSIVSQEVAERLASMTTAAPDFKILWDNAYAFHHLTEAEAKSADILSLASAAGHPHRPIMFASTSKITYAGAGVAFLAGSVETVRWYIGHLGKGAIGPDKLNQLRHAQFFGSAAGRARPHGPAPRDHRAEVRRRCSACSREQLGGLGHRDLDRADRRLLHQPRRAGRHRRPRDRAGQGRGGRADAGRARRSPTAATRTTATSGWRPPSRSRPRWSRRPGVGRDLRPAGRRGEAGWLMSPGRSLRELPKAHLHLHFTGSMRHATLLELAERDGIRLPDQLVSQWPPELSAADEKGWFRFQRLYDVARSVLRTEADVRRLVLRGRRGRRPRRRRLAGDPGRPERVRRPVRRHHRVHRPGARRGPRPRRAQTGLGDGRGHRRQPHPAPARRAHPGPARRAVRRPRRGRLRPLQRRAPRHRPPTSRGAFRIAERAGLLLVPHGGELRGPEHIAAAASTPCTPSGSATASASAEDPALLDRIVAAGVALEVCPVSNVALGVYSDLTSVPLPDAARGRARRSRSAPTTRCCSAPGWPASTPRCAPPTSSPTTSWPSWPGCRCAPRRPPTTCGRGCSTASTRGCRCHHPRRERRRGDRAVHAPALRPDDGRQPVRLPVRSRRRSPPVRRTSRRRCPPPPTGAYGHRRPRQPGSSRGSSRGRRRTARRTPARWTTRARPPRWCSASSRSSRWCWRRSPAASPLPGVLCAPFAWVVGAKAMREIDRLAGHLRQPRRRPDRDVDGDRDDAPRRRWRSPASSRWSCWIGLADPTLV